MQTLFYRVAVFYEIDKILKFLKVSSLIISILAFWYKLPFYEA